MRTELPAFFAEITPLVAQGKIKVRVQRYEGIEQAGQALADVQRGDNNGKALVVISEE